MYFSYFFNSILSIRHLFTGNSQSAEITAAITSVMSLDMVAWHPKEKTFNKTTKKIMVEEKTVYNGE
jgi:hypothetical protein